MIVYLHGTLYAAECGWDHTFEAYVAGPLAAFCLRGSPRERIWIAENSGRIVGCIAIVESEPDLAQLRWYLVHPSARGRGLGRRLLARALDFSRAAGYRSVHLWTVSALAAARHLYNQVGFQLTLEKTSEIWGAVVVEQRYDLSLQPDQ